MRVGRLKHLSKLLSKSGEALVENMFISITEPDTYINFGAGLLSSERTVIRARWQADNLVQAGNWIRTDTGRLFLIMGFSQPKTRQDLVIGAREAMGYQATFVIGTDENGNDIEATGFVALLNYLEKPSDGNGFMPVEQRQRAEFANVEHRPEAGQEFTVNNQKYRILELDASGSNELVTSAWVAPQ